MNNMNFVINLSLSHSFLLLFYNINYKHFLNNLLLRLIITTTIFFLKLVILLSVQLQLDAPFRIIYVLVHSGTTTFRQVVRET